MLLVSTQDVINSAQMPLRVAVDLGPAGVGSATAPRHVRLVDGTEMALKCAAWAREPNPHLCANEWIAGLIARQCGLRTLRMATVRHPAGLAIGWEYLASGMFASLGADSRVIDAAENAEMIYAVAAFDALVRNVDRHAGNVVAQRLSRNTPGFRLLVYDHDRSIIHPLVTPNDLYAVPALEDSRLWMSAPGLRAAIRDRQRLLDAVATVRASCSAEDIEEIVISTPVEWLAVEHHMPVVHFLSQRLRTLDLIVSKHVGNVLPHLV